MPLIKVNFKPGVNRNTTNYSGEGNWWDGDKIRFRDGFPEKIGGWVKYTPTAFLGVCRQLHNWVTTFSDNLLALGTHNKLYIQVSGTFYDITPLRATTPTLTTTDTDNCIHTTNTSTTVTVDLGAVAHLAATGDFVTISGVTGDIGGVPDAEINANHKITVVDANEFNFVVTTAATSSVAGGGGTAISIDFEITPGNAIVTAGYGWGTGTWGRGTWGLSSGSSSVNLPQRDWFVDNFDNDLVANIREGTPYYWSRGATSDPATSLGTRAVAMSAQATTDGFTAADVPVKVGQLLVSSPDKHLIAFGAVPFGSVDTADYDPLLIRWSDQNAPTNWTPTSINSSGFLRASRGDKIVRAASTGREHLVWTNSHLYGLQFLGTTDVFGIQEYADNVSIISPRASATASDITYWMGTGKFYAYTGRVETLPCTLLDYIFNDINYAQAGQIVCGTNEAWNEVWWFYCSGSSNWNDRYVVYNHLDRIWYYGTMERTAWLDNKFNNCPFAVGGTSAAVQGFLYQHENGNDDDSSAMTAYIQSNDFDLGDGDQYMLSKRIIPDLKFLGSDASTPAATIQLRPRTFPGVAQTAETADTQTVTESSVDVYTEQVFIRARARQMALKISSTASGVQWQLGSPRIDVRPDGKR